MIVDHLSELGEATRDAVRPGRADFPANALVVTSRYREKLGNAGGYIETLRGVGYRFKEQPDEALA